MVRLKKCLSTVLLAALLLQTTACGGDTSADITTTAPGTESTTTEAAPVSEYTAPDVDYGGKTVNILGYSYSGTWDILRYNVALDEENGDVINDAIVKRNRAVEEDLNVKIDLIPLGQSDRSSSEKFQKYVMAQEDAFAFGMQMSVGLAPLITTENMLVDLKDIPTLDLTHTWWNQNANEAYTLQGSQLTAIGDICFFNLGAPIVMYFSKALADEYKLGNLYQLVYDGKWTLDTMLKMASIGAQDVNGDSKMDENDIYGFAGENRTLAAFLLSSDIMFTERDKDGNIKPTLNNEKTVSVIEKVVPMMRNKTVALFGPEWDSLYAGSPHPLFLMPKLKEAEILFYSQQLLVALNLRSMESDFGILPMPKYDEAQEEYLSSANTWWSDHIVVPTTNGDLEMTGHLLDAMGYYAQQYITPAFIDVSVVGKSTRDEDSVNMIHLILENSVFEVSQIFGWGGMIGMLEGIANEGNTNFTSAWAGIESAVNTELAKTMSMLKGN